MEPTPKIDASTISVPGKGISVIPEQTGQIKKIPEQNLHIQKILGDNELIRSTKNNTYIRNKRNKHAPLHILGSDAANAILRKEAYQYGGNVPSSFELKEINELLFSWSTMEIPPREVFCYVAKINGGVEYDIGDADNTRVRITAGKLELLKSGSETLFYRSNNSRPFPYPAEHGDFNLLDRYLGNINKADRMLLIVLLAYTLAHPKIPSTNYVILALLGGQGCGKSVLSNIISSLLSPSLLGAQVMPKNQKDLVVAAQNAHVLIIDNLRKLNQQQSDDLCVMATGGHISCRRLYTDGDQFVMPLHAGLVINSIHDFMTESDLAQRSLVLRLNPMDETQRVSEKQLQADLENDLPIIFRGLLDLSAQIFVHLPEVEIKHHERMIDFVHWLAAKEQIDGVPTGVYQAAYSDNLQEGQLDSLMDDVLAETLMEFTEVLLDEWKGEPKKLLTRLNDMAPRFTPRDWPNTPTALSRRLRSAVSITCQWCLRQIRSRENTLGTNRN